MKMNLNIEYKSSMGRDVYVSGSVETLGKWVMQKAVKMTCKKEKEWSVDLELPNTIKSYEYKYVVAGLNGEEAQWESGVNRIQVVNRNFDVIEVTDSWREKNNFLSILSKSVFNDILFKRDESNKVEESISKLSKNQKFLSFEVCAPKLDSKHKLCLVGNVKELGEWNYVNPVIMNCIAPTIWGAGIVVDKWENISYKYGIYDTVSNKVIFLESGSNRLFIEPSQKSILKSILRVDDIFKYSNYEWHGTGVAIPVFSLRSKKGMGVGEFLDIKLLVDWCNKVDIKLIQILPVNDTIHTHTWVDSYPYSAISVYALHPMYLNMEAIGKLPADVTNDIVNERINILNENDTVDYESVMNLKSRYHLMAYEAHKTSFLKDKDFKKFFKSNQNWLEPYAAYCYLRDLYGTFDYSKWMEYSIYDKHIITKLVSPTAKQFDDIAVHYFIQYHLHKQLLDAVQYARKNGVIIKGDIPIGVNRYGVDTWMEPILFNMDSQTGAPPDDYAVDGQNWGFPTYNWDEMSKDGYKWWRSRLTQLSKYFDAFRIDHVLGFFRIWEIPYIAVSGLLGHFSPAVPVRKSELDALNIEFSEERFCTPCINSYIFDKFGQDNAQYLIDNYLIENDSGSYCLRPEFDTQRKIENYLSITPDMSIEDRSKVNRIKRMLFELIADVLFVKDKSIKDCYHPRITINKTTSFQVLESDSQKLVNDLYFDYYYNRQEQLWKEQAVKKLPALVHATNMLVCGEDLGMVPECVPGVMDDLALLSLKIQRMPKEEWLSFGIPADYPYMSVCSPSCHDMSTIRGWWEEDYEITQKFYNECLGCEGEAPISCEPWICDKIIKQHLASPSMLAIFPLQDLLATSLELRRKNPKDEKINEPSNPKHYWRYRFHIPLEDLIKEEALNEHIKGMIIESNRNIVTY